MCVAGRERRNRGQAIQLGALLLFAILIINLSLFQIFVVPNQNSGIEFKHSEEVRSDMLNARNAVLDAATGDQSFVKVNLAPAYPSRTLFVNPGQPAGTVRTTEAQPISITNDTSAPGGGTDISSDACPGTPETRALEYRAGYNYYDSAPTYRVENTVLFRGFPGETLPGSGQQLVTGNTINLLPLQNEFSESGTGAATVEPVPGGVLTTNVVDPEIQLPTEYSEAVWEETLSGAVPADDISVSGDTLTLTLSGNYALNCGPIGVNGAPPSGARSGGLVGSGGSGGDGSINPAGFSEVRLTDISEVSNSAVEITLKNTDSKAKSLAQGRIPFYYGATGGSSARPEYADLNGDPADQLGIRDRFETIDQDIEIGANGGKETVTFEFDDKITDDFFVFKVAYSDGTRATYYIDAPKKTGGGGPTATPTSTPTSTPGGPGFSSISASTLDAGETGGGAEQTLTFSPDQDLPNGETVSIDLSDAQDATAGNTNQYQVDYQSASPTVVAGSGSVQFTTQTSTGAVIEFTSNGVSASDTVEIEITSITTGSNGQQSDPYDAVFDRSDGGSQTTTFLVN